MKQTEKLAVIALLTLTLMTCYKPSINATLLGHYRGTGYNFFNQLYQFLIPRATLIQALPDTLKAAFTTHAIPLNTIQINASAVVWGQLHEPQSAPKDRVYNVVFHPDVLNWRGSDADVNTNILAGLFAPDGVAPANNPIAINTLAMLNVNKHDQIYYSPNNGRFTIQPGRTIATFWTAGISENKTKTFITFNILIDNAQYQNQLSQAITSAQSQHPRARSMAVLHALELITAQLHGPDKATLEKAISTIRTTLGIAQPSGGGAAGAEASATAPAEEARKQEQRDEELARELAEKYEREQTARAQRLEAEKLAQEQERMQAEQHTREQATSQSEQAQPASPSTGGAAGAIDPYAGMSARDRRIAERRAQRSTPLNAEQIQANIDAFLASRGLQQ